MAITDPTLYALALSEAGALYSRRACRFAAVLSGVLRKNDVVEIVHLDGRARTARVTSVPGKVLSARDPNGQIAFSDLDRKDLSRGDIIRAPGLGTPPLSLRKWGGLQRLSLLHAVRSARKSGFDPVYAGLLCHLPYHLPDEALVLFLEKAVREALRSVDSPHNIRTAFEEAALLYDAIRRPEDADRLRLAAASLLEGRAVSWTLTNLNSPVVAEMATTPTTRKEKVTADETAWPLQMAPEEMPPHEKRHLRVQGRSIRQRLQEEGRAIATGWCPACKSVTRLDGELRCPRGHEHIKDAHVIVASEAQEHEEYLWRRYRRRRDFLKRAANSRFVNRVAGFLTLIRRRPP